MNRFEQIQWVVQQNLTGENALCDLKKACALTGVDFVATTVIPAIVRSVTGYFSEQLQKLAGV